MCAHYALFSKYLFQKYIYFKHFIKNKKCEAQGQKFTHIFLDITFDLKKRKRNLRQKSIWQIEQSFTMNKQLAWLDFEKIAKFERLP